MASQATRLGKDSSVTVQDKHIVTNRLDPIEELYNMYSEEEDTPRIVEVVNDRLDFDLDVEGLADPCMDL